MKCIPRTLVRVTPALLLSLLLLVLLGPSPCRALLHMRPGPRDEPTIDHQSRYSAVKCWGDHPDDRVCHMKNFCFDHDADRFQIFVESEQARERWAQEVPNPPACLHSKQGLWPIFFDVKMEPFPAHSEQDYVEEEFAIVLRQYVEGNSYHLISEDFMPGFHLASFFAPEIAEHYDEGGEPELVQDAIDKRAKFVFLDWIYQGDYSRSKAMFLWTLLSDQPLAWGGLHWERSHEHFGTARTCFRSAGIAAPRLPRSQDDGWHGPPKIVDFADGLLTRMAADFVLKELGLSPTTFESMKPNPRVVPHRQHIQLVDVGELHMFQHEQSQKPLEECSVTLISRKRTRVILNEEELASAVMRAEGVTNLEIIDEDAMTGEEIIKAIRGSQVLIGMHGAGLAWGIFLPYNATVIELTSYGAQPEFFNYFHSMFSIPNVGINYEMWQNNNASFAHGPRGGLVETMGILSKSNEEIIDCLAMPIKRHPYSWGSHCLNYWRDHDNGLAVTEVVDLVSAACAGKA